MSLNILGLNKKRSGSIRIKKNTNGGGMITQTGMLDPQATLVKGDLRDIVACPKYVDKTEWLAINTFDFFNHINLYQAITSDSCKNCKEMTAGDHEYLLEVDKRYISAPASNYIHFAMSSISAQLDDEKIFPTQAQNQFPKDFENIVKTIFKRLFRILAHIYYSHFDLIVQAGADGHLNTLFTHFILFSNQFDLIDQREYAPLADLIEKLVEKGSQKY